MRIKMKHNGFSLIEMLVVITIIASLIGVAIPAIDAMQKSYNSTGTLSMIEAALSSARAMAISNNRYVGVRFQKAANTANANVEDDPLNRNQYMLFITIDEDMGTLTNAYRILKGYKPVKLPENIGVMDTMLNDDKHLSVVGDSMDTNDITDVTTFSIVFSPSGKLVLANVQTRNRNGATNDTSEDDVINSQNQIKAGYGMFLQDSVQEHSRRKFVIYSRKEFTEYLNDNPPVPYSDYLSRLRVYRVNPYTGTIIK